MSHSPTAIRATWSFPCPFLALSLAASLLLGAAGCSDPDEPADPQYLQLSYESIPGSGVVLPVGSVDVSGSNYADKLAFTEEVFDNLVPMVMSEVGLDAAGLSSDLVPGGFLLETNPSMQTRLPVDDYPDADALADQLAAALGYTMYQWSVLVTDFSAVDGDTGYATVRFASGALSAELAQQFFEHAASVDDGLGGGYMAFDDDMIFVNVRDDAGAPYSGLDDQTFIDGIEEAADTFAEAEAALYESGMAAARLVGNDWDSATTGDEYLATVGADAAPGLAPLQDSFEQRIEDAASTYGWTLGTGLTGPRPDADTRRGHPRDLARLRRATQRSH